MSIKRILVPLPSSADHSREVETALATAKSLGAFVQALYITPPPPPPRAAANSYGYAGRTAAAFDINAFAEERERHARAAREGFEQACHAAGVPLAAQDQPIALPMASWHEVEGSFVEIAVRRAAAFDLVVAASAAVMNSLADAAERSLLRARRPVLLAPVQPEKNLTDSVMIAWDESPECWHAVSAAVPFLKLANAVRIVSVDRDAARRAQTHAEVMAYLRCHGVNASARVVRPDQGSVGETLLAVAAEDDAGMLVMGAYSHSRLREMLLGGATRHILQHAVARPIFLMH